MIDKNGFRTLIQHSPVSLNEFNVIQTILD